MVELSVARRAIEAIDAGDQAALEAEIAAHPELLRDRIDEGEGYFKHPYLLWYVAGNPVREERLPGNIVELARTIIAAARRAGVESLQEQVDYTLSLVCSGRVPRESGAQIALIDALREAGADPDGAMLPALAHHEVAAAEHLLARGARLTLTAAICLGRDGEVARLAHGGASDELDRAFAAAALYGKPEALALLLDLGCDPGAFAPGGFHPHATPLHHAVNSGNLEAVRLLVEAGADLHTKDRVYAGTPLDWAEYLKQDAIADYLRGQ